MVATLHGDLTEAEGEFLAAVEHRVHLVAISRAQEALVAGVDWRRVVYNGVDPADYTPITNPDEKHNYVLQLARISPNKGQHIAIEVARRIGMPLVLAGKVDNDASEYFEQEVKPHLGNGVTWHENIEGEEKQHLLARARAMLFPIQWEEPFGIAMVEAMVSGTPVIAMARGAANEIVEPGVTGWLARDTGGLVDAYRAPRRNRPGAMRQTSERALRPNPNGRRIRIDPLVWRQTSRSAREFRTFGVSRAHHQSKR